jgi:hypothetical protein
MFMASFQIAAFWKIGCKVVPANGANSGAVLLYYLLLALSEKVCLFSL